MGTPKANDAQVEQLFWLLDLANCPCCDGSGAYYSNHGKPVQCQWCYERTTIIEELRPQIDTRIEAQQ